MTSTLEEPRIGPCAPWVSATEVLAARELQPTKTWDGPGQALAAQMAMAASEIAYFLSARQFTGACGPVTVRPLARPTDIDTRFGHRGLPSGYQTAGQAASAYGQPGAGAVNYFGTSKPSEVYLGAYPIIDVLQVKIDGVLIPPSEYYLQDARFLVRNRPSAAATPTERYGWPVNQLLDLPDTQEGTFSVTYMYGVPPPASGVAAALKLATELTLDAVGSPSGALPLRTTTVNRQGVTVQTTDVMDFLSKGVTGIYQLDLFVLTFNPTKARAKPLIFSPDTGRARRMPRNFH